MERAVLDKRIIGLGPVLEAVANREPAGALGRLTRLLMPSPVGDGPTYKVIKTRPLNRRAGRRARVRLATGKLFDKARRFVAECHIYDVSIDGFRIRAPKGAEMINVTGFYDDATGRIYAIAHIWSENGYIGFRTLPREIDEAADSKLRRRLSGPYYALD
jgi:hypothetical protein